MKSRLSFAFPICHATFYSSAFFLDVSSDFTLIMNVLFMSFFVVFFLSLKFNNYLYVDW